MPQDLGGEFGLVYRAEVDEQGCPDDPQTDARFLVCSRTVKDYGVSAKVQ